METAPLLTDVADGPEGGLAHWVTTEDGLRLRIAQWGTGTKGTVLLFPGRTEYIEKYGRAARAFEARGYTTAIIDFRGQGLAERMLPDRTKGHVESFPDYQHDVRALVAYARAQGLPEPYYLVAHSMGGGIGLRALMEDLPVKAAAFSGPMWGIALSPPMRAFAKIIAGIAGPFGFKSARAPMTDKEAYVLTVPFEENTLTRDREMMAYMQSHARASSDIIVSGPTIQWADEALRETQHLATRPSPNVPCFCAYGTNERIVDVDAIKDRMARWQGGTIKAYEAGEHEIMMEIPATREDFFDQATALFGQHS